MTVAFVLGNGVSRKNISLPYLKQRGKIYGCNALYRDFTPDVLVATDRPISEEIQNSKYALENRFHTRKPVPGLGALPLIQKYYGYSSGPNALGLACQDGHRIIYLVGFDMAPDENQQFNNVYADTEFYKKSGSNPTFTGNWIKQLCTIMNDYPENKFYRIVGPTTGNSTELDALRNLQSQSLDSFVDRINNQKDL
jgi:hypothetical protein